jgi:hypothetical protein
MRERKQNHIKNKQIQIFGNLMNLYQNWLESAPEIALVRPKLYQISCKAYREIINRPQSLKVLQSPSVGF